LFTINGLDIKDERFCKEVDEWLETLKKNSTLISEVSSKERFIFLSTQKKKILSLIKSIEEACLTEFVTLPELTT
jgi:hypothetical protein